MGTFETNFHSPPVTREQAEKTAVPVRHPPEPHITLAKRTEESPEVPRGQSWGAASRQDPNLATRKKQAHCRGSERPPGGKAPLLRQLHLRPSSTYGGFPVSVPCNIECVEGKDLSF